MVVSEVRVQYRDADSLLFHTVIKRIYSTGSLQIGCQEGRTHLRDDDPVQRIEYSDGWIIPPEWEFTHDIQQNGT